MSDPREKKSGPTPEKGPTGQSKGKRLGKQPEKKPVEPLLRRNTGGTKKSAQVPRTTRQKVLKGLYNALTAVSACIVLGYIGWNIFAAPPSVDKPGLGGVSEVLRPPITTQYVDEETGRLVEAEIPGLSTDRKKEFYTFLLIGQSQDQGGKLSDTMMLAAYDVPNQALSVMSLPRDTYVRYNGKLMLLNGVYNAAGGYKDDEKGVQGLKKAVRDLTGVYPDFHVVIQWEALGELVDAIGGVYFDVPFDMYYNDLSQHFKINVKKGYQLLNGEKAMGVVRWRHNSDDRGNISKSYGYAEGDIGRIKTQQAFLKEVIKQCLQMDKLLKNLGDYVTIFQKNVLTDLSIGNIAYFAQSALTGLDMDKVSFETMPWYSAGNAHILPTGSQIVKAVNKGFNPYRNDIRLGELKLAAMDDVPKPSESPAPEESGEPEAADTPGPDGTSRPSGGDGVLLPPGTFTRPTSSPSPGGSPRPGESARPGESTRPAGSPRPSGSPRPENSAQPTRGPSPTESGVPGPTPSRPAELSPPPADMTVSPPPEEEPLLPPM